MDNPTHWIDAPTGDSLYAPKWVRGGRARRQGQLRTADLAEDKTVRTDEGIGSILARAGDPLRPETNPSVNHFLESALQPDIVPYPWSAARHGRQPFNARDILYGSIIGVAAGLALTLFVIGKVPPAGNMQVGDATGSSFAERFAGQPSARGTAEQINPVVGAMPERRL